MMIYPAPHYSMGGLWVDYELQTTIPGLFAIGEANFSDHGANRLGASAMMQCLADGYFIAPHTVTNWISGVHDHVPTRPPRLRRGRARCPRADRAPARRRGHDAADRVPPRARPPDARPLRDHARGGRAAGGDRQGPRDPRGVLVATCRSSPATDGHQPDARVRRPGRRLPRAGGADVPRRARARRVVRLPPARGAPDRGGRGASATTSASRTPRSGSGRARTPSTETATRARSSSRRSSRRRGATSEVHPAASGARRTPRRRAASSATRSRTSIPTPRSSRCSTC